MNNPLTFMEAIKNPNAFFNNIMNNSNMKNNPIAQNVIKMYQNGDSKGLRDLGLNLCRERGITEEQLKLMFK